MLHKITALLDSKILNNGVIMENLKAAQAEVLRRIGVGVCDTFINRIIGFLPDSWKFKLLMATPSGKAIGTVLMAQAIGQTMYIFKDKLSPDNQRYLDLIRTSAWSASATALCDIANLDRIFDMLVPDSMKKLLDNGMKEIKQIENKIDALEANK